MGVRARPDDRGGRFTEADAAFIVRRRFFFLTPTDAEGRPDCAFKGGDS
jgi:hypothetical protein